MSVQFFDNENLQGQPLAHRAFVRRHVNSSKARSSLQLFFLEEDELSFSHVSFFGDNGEVFHSLADLLEAHQDRWSWDSEELRVERALELADVVSRVASRGSEWARAVGWE